MLEAGGAPGGGHQPLWQAAALLLSQEPAHQHNLIVNFSVNFSFLAVAAKKFSSPRQSHWINKIRKGDFFPL